MGCASAKPKRTHSADDINAPGKSDTNGEIKKTKAFPLKAGKKDKRDSRAIEIPGQNQSFLAPDGIPFIDEDVDTEDAVVVSVETQETNKVALATRNEPSRPQPKEPHQQLVISHSETGNKGVIDDILSSEKQMHVSKVESEQVITREEKEGNKDVQITEKRVVVVEENAANNTVVTEESIKVEVTGPKVKSQDEAAVKIQAGIRGYLDRKRVKAIRENQQQQPTDDDNKVLFDNDVEVAQQQQHDDYKQQLDNDVHDDVLPDNDLDAAQQQQHDDDDINQEKHLTISLDAEEAKHGELKVNMTSS